MNNLIGFLIGVTLTLAAFWLMAPDLEERDIPSYVPGTVRLHGSALR